MYSSQKIKTSQQALASLELTCARMERCVSDVRRSLYRWGIVSHDDQDEIIQLLVHKRFIDENRYASAYVRDKLITGRWGIMKIRAGLRAKGIDRQIIDQAIEQNAQPDEMQDKLTQNIRKHYEREQFKTENRYQLRAKLFRRAASQGFDIEDINYAIDKVFDE